MGKLYWVKAIQSCKLAEIWKAFYLIESEFCLTGVRKRELFPPMFKCLENRQFDECGLLNISFLLLVSF